MAEKDAALLDRMETKREELLAYMSKVRPRKRRLTNLTLFCGSAATVLTATPGLGGEAVTSWLALNVFGATAPAWQILCLGATLCTVTATVATQILKSRDLEVKLIKAQTAAAKLEVIATDLQSGNIENQRASAEYLRCVEDTAFLQT